MNYQFKGHTMNLCAAYYCNPMLGAQLAGGLIALLLLIWSIDK